MPFQYEGYRSPFANSIAELMLRRGDIAARQAEQSGNAWAGAAQTIGQSVAAMPAQIQQAQRAQLVDANLASEITDRNAQATQRTAALKANTAVDQIMQTSLKQDPTTGVFSFDRPSFEQGLIQGGMGHLYPTLAETLDKLDASATKRNAEGRTMLAETLVGIGKAGYTPQSVLSGAAFLKANQVITNDHLQPVLDAITADPSPANIQAVVTKLGTAIPEYGKLLDAEETRKAGLAKTTADTAKLTADTAKTTAEAANLQRFGRPTAGTPDEQAQDAFARSLGKTTAADLTYAERQRFDQNKAKLTSDQAFTQHQRERQYDISNPIPEKAANQDKLEQQYRTVLVRAMSSRSGGIGAEDAKVQQANHLLGMLDQFRDDKTGDINIPRVQLNELALGLAKLTAGTGPAGEGMMREFQQRTAKGDLAGALTYLTGQAVPANTQDITKMLEESIQRQGAIAEQNREGEMRYLRGLAPTELEEPRRAALEANTLNPLRQSRLAKDTKGTVKRFLSTDGGKTWK